MPPSKVVICLVAALGGAGTSMLAERVAHKRHHRAHAIARPAAAPDPMPCTPVLALPGAPAYAPPLAPLHGTRPAGPVAGAEDLGVEPGRPGSFHGAGPTASLSGAAPGFAPGGWRPDSRRQEIEDRSSDAAEETADPSGQAIDVPEPAATLPIAGGVLSLAARRRWRKA